MPTLKSPFPWYGGKSKVAQIVWERFGNVPNYVEPFFGSGAVLLGRPHVPNIETINDLDCYVANAWRSIQWAPDEVAHHTDWPVNEADLHARHIWLVQQKDELSYRVMGNPEYYDARIAGYWIWGVCVWIGGEFCSGKGPWTSVDGKLAHLSGDGQGVQRRLVHLSGGRGVQRRRVHLGAGKGVQREQRQELYIYMQSLANRLKRVRVCCGEWTRILGPSVTVANGLTGVFLDPPYDQDERSILYTTESNVSKDVRQWAIENGNNPQLRIALCGYEGEHDMPDNWSVYAWKTQRGYANLGKRRGQENISRERIWFSPHCLKYVQFSMF